MVELLIAMAVLSIGLLALFTMFQSSMLSITRASQTSTAAALADTEMEAFRAVRYEAIGLDEADIAGTNATYTSDAAYEATPPTASTWTAARAAPRPTRTPCPLRHLQAPTGETTGWTGLRAVTLR